MGPIILYVIIFSVMLFFSIYKAITMSEKCNNLKKQVREYKSKIKELEAKVEQTSDHYQIKRQLEECNSKIKLLEERRERTKDYDAIAKKNKQQEQEIKKLKSDLEIARKREIKHRETIASLTDTINKTSALKVMGEHDVLEEDSDHVALDLSPDEFAMLNDILGKGK